MARFHIPPWLKYGILGILVAVTFTDMAVDMFYEVSCTQNGKAVPAVDVTGNATCVSTSGLRILLGNVNLMEWKAKYEGEMRMGKMHGNGKYTTAHGATYEGSWADDQRLGNGTFTHADGLTMWKGTWDRDELTGPDNEMKTWRSNIFNKLGSGGLPAVHSASFIGFTVNGFANGEGKIVFYAQGQQQEPIFSVEGTFVDGALVSPTEDIYITFGPSTPKEISRKRLVLREWKSDWHYGHQSVEGKAIFDGGRLQYRFSNGALQLLDSTGSTTESPIKAISTKNNVYHDAFQASIEAIRAFEWHFIFNRVQLGHLISLTSSDAHDTSFTTPIIKSHGDGLSE